MAKVLIAEPSYLVRKGLLRLLEQLPGVTQVKVAEHSDDFFQTIKAFSPDILLLNSTFSYLGSVKDLLGVLHPKARFIQIVNVPLAKDASFEQISIFEGKASLVEKISRYLKPFEVPTGRLGESEELTPREKLILRNVALGYTNKEIAARLFISTHTVISHRKNITRKLEIKTVSGLTVYAILNNLIKMEDIT